MKYKTSQHHHSGTKEKKAQNSEEDGGRNPVGWSKTVVLPAKDRNLPPFMEHISSNRETSSTPVLKPCSHYSCCGRVWFLTEEVHRK